MNEKPMMKMDIQLRAPKGMSKEVAVAIFQQMFAEMQQVAPLAPHEVKIRVAQELLGDYEVLAKLRQSILEAPPNAVWGVAVIEPAFVDMPGLDEKGIYIEACVRMDQAVKQGIEAVMKTATCFAYITSSSTRGLLSMNGYRLRFEPPYVPGHEQLEDGVEG